MYSGALPDELLDEQVSELLLAAEKYAIEQLKMLCQEKLIPG
jgi:hypothetical protein